MVAPVPARVPATEPRPWYRSRRSFAAKGGGGKVLVAGLGLTYTDHATGALLLANVDMGFRARTLSAILDPTGRRARALAALSLRRRVRGWRAWRAASARWR